MNINDTINAFANAWKSIIAVGSIILIILFNKQFKELLGRLKKIKFEKGENKAEIECSPADINYMDNNINTTDNTQLDVTKEKIEVIETDAIESEIVSEEEKINSKSLYNAFINRDIKKLKFIFLELEKKETNNGMQLRNKAFYLNALFNLGETYAINELVELVEKNSDTKECYFINRMLANCYEGANQLEEALQCYIAATLCETNELEKSKDIISNADTLRRLGQKAEAYTVIKDAIKSLKDRNAIFGLYEKLAKYYKDDNEKVMGYIALEKALELQPNNIDTYFSLGYAYSEEKLWRVSGLYHYKKLLKFNPENNGALNNVAVAYSNLELKSKAVKNYKKAFEQGSSLSGANLAHMMMNCGLTEEARILLEKAETLTDVHKNVKSAIIQLNDIEDQENKKEDSYLEEASIIQRFFRNYGEVCFKNKDKNSPLQGNWKAEGNASISFCEEDGDIVGIFKVDDKEKKLICATSYNYSEFKSKVNAYDYNSHDYKLTEDGTGYLYISQDNEILNIMLLCNGTCKIYNMKRSS